MTVSAALTLEDVVDRRRRKQRIQFIIAFVLFLAILWSIKTTVIDDTDWERIGSFG